jgi:hypothetical protein
MALILMKLSVIVKFRQSIDGGHVALLQLGKYFT